MTRKKKVFTNFAVTNDVADIMSGTRGSVTFAQNIFDIRSVEEWLKAYCLNAVEKSIVRTVTSENNDGRHFRRH